MTTQRLSLIVVTAISTVLGCVVISLRGYVVLVLKRPSGYDDLFMSLAWLFSIGFAAATWVSIASGSGTDPATVTLPAIVGVARSAYAVELIYACSLLCIKLSILTLYLRIAGLPNHRTRKATIATIVLLVAQFVAIMIVAGFQCRPIQTFWNPTIPGKCIDIIAYFYALAAWTVITDVVILIIPMPMLWAIKRPRAERLALCSIFLLGFTSTIISGVRIHSIWIYATTKHPLRDAAPINMWSYLEIICGMLCASGSVMRAVLRRSRGTTSAVSTVYTEDRERWKPERSYQITTSTTYDGTTYTGNSYCVKSGIEEQLQDDEEQPSVWDGRGPSYKTSPIVVCDSLPITQFDYISSLHLDEGTSTRHKSISYDWQYK